MRILLLTSILFLSSCLSFPKASERTDSRRGACIITLPDRVICAKVTLLSCFDSMGEYNGDGSTCGDTSPNLIAEPEPSPIYLDKTVIYSIGGAITAIAAAWASNKAIKRRRKKRGIK